MASETILQINNLYRTNPSLFTPQARQWLGQELNNAGYLSDGTKAPKEFDLFATVGQAFSGFVHGFTTIPVGDDPENDAEYIARNIGHLLGFMGVIPGVGSVGKIAASAAGRTAMLLGRESMLAARVAEVGSKAIRLKSLPMLTADVVMNGARAFAKNTAALDAVKFLQRGSIARDMVSGGVHLGIASATSAAPFWQLAVDERLEAMKGGIAAGVVFRGIGNTFAKGGKIDLGKHFEGHPLKDHIANTIARSTSAALFMGLPATLRDEPLPIQVYEYVTGAMFGGFEKPAYMREIAEFAKPYQGDMVQQRKLMNPKSLKGFDTLTKPSQDHLIAMGDDMLDRSRQTAAMIANAVGGSADDALKAGKITPDQWLKWREGNAIEIAYKDEANRQRSNGVQDELVIDEASKEHVRKQIAEYVQMVENTVSNRNLANHNDFDSVIATIDDALVAGNRHALQKKFEEAGVEYSFASPLTEISKQLHSFDNTKPLLEYQKELVELVGRTRSRDDFSGYDKFREAVRKNYANQNTLLTLEDGTDTERALRKVWLQSTFDKKAMELIVNTKSEVVPQGDYDATGKRVATLRPLTFYELTTSRPVAALKNVEVPDAANPESVSMKPVHEANVNLSETIWKAYQATDAKGLPDPWMFVAGKKDNAELEFQKQVASFTTREDGTRVYRFTMNGQQRKYAFSEKLQAIQQALLESGSDEVAADTFNANFEAFKKELGFDHADDASLRSMYEHVYMNDVAILETLNSGVKYEDMIRAGKKKFIITPADLNKRMQVIHSGDYVVDASTFKGVEGIENDALKGIIVKVDEKDPNAVFQSWFKDDKTGLAYRKAVETHLDGVTFLRWDVFDALARSTGAPLESGGQKGTISFTEDGKGMFLGKLLFHRASPQMNEHLTLKGWHYQIYDTAAKQIGSRALHSEMWDAESKTVRYRHERVDAIDKRLSELEKEYDNKLTTEGRRTEIEDEIGSLTNERVSANALEVTEQLPLSGVRMNLGAGEVEKPHSTEAKIQFSGNLSPELAKLWVDTMVRMSWHGMEAENAKFDAFLKDGSANPADIDLHGVGVQRLYSILIGDQNPDTKLFRKALEVVRTAEFTDTDEILDVETKADLEGFDKAKSVADRILSVAEPTPFVMDLKPVRPYFDTLLRNYARNRATKPRLQYSWKSKSYGLDMFLQHKYKLNAGEYLAADGLRDMPVEVAGKRTELGKAWDEFQKLGGWEAIDKGEKNRIADLADSLEHFVIRVPADSASGIRVSRFKGFVEGSKGWGVFLHPEDMVYLGGMDQDGDSVDVITRLPNKQLHDGVKKHYRNMKDQWYENVPDTNGMLQKVMRPSSNEDFLAETEREYNTLKNIGKRAQEQQDRFDELDAIMKRRKSPVSLADPLTLAKINRWAYNGNQLLGSGLLHARRLQELQRLAALNHGVIGGSINVYQAARMKLQGLLPGLERLSENQRKEYAELASTKTLEGNARNRFFELERMTGTQDFKWTMRVNPNHSIESITRNIVNSAADAAKGDEMITRDEMKRRVSRQAFTHATITYNEGGRRVQGKVEGGTVKTINGEHAIDATMHPTYRAMSKIDATLKGKDYATGKAFTLDEVTKRLFDSKDKANGVAHMWYQAGQLLADLQFSKNITPRWLGGEFDARRAAIKERFEKHPELAKIAFRWVPSVNAESIETYIMKNESRFTPERLARNVSELYTNDIADLASAEILMDIGERYLEAGKAAGKSEAELLKRLSNIAAKSTEFKLGDADRLRQKHDDMILAGITNKLTLRDLYDQGMAFRKRLNPIEQEYFDAYMVGSSRGQGEASDGSKNKLQNVGFSWDFVSSKAVKRMIDTMSDIAMGRVNSVLPQSDLAAIKKLKLDEISGLLDKLQPVAKKLDTGWKVKEYHENFMSRLEELGESAIVNDPETKAMGEQLRKLLFHYPQLLRNFERVWEGEIARMSIAGVGVSPEIATKDMLRRFLNRFTYKGKMWHELSEKEKHRALRRRDFLYDPEMLARNLETGDASVVDMTAKVMTASGELVEKPVKYVIGHFGTMTEIWQASHFAYNASIARAREEMERGAADFEGGLQFVRQLGEDGEMLFAIASDLRQAGLTRESLNGKPYKPKYDYAQEAEEAQKEFNRRYANGTKQLFFTSPEGERISTTAREALKRVQRTQSMWAERVGKYLVNEEAEAKYIKKFDGSDLIDVRRTLQEFYKIIREGKEFPMLGLNTLYRVHHQMKLDRIEVTYREFENGTVKAVHATDPQTEGVKRELIGNISNVAHRVSLLEQMKGNEKFNVGNWMTFQPVRLLETKSYFPHGGYNRKAAERYLQEIYEHMKKFGANDAELMDAEIELRTEANDGMSNDGGISEVVQSLEQTERITPENVHRLNVHRMNPSATKHRGIEPLVGWDKSTEALWRYEQQALRGYYNTVGSLMSQSVIHDFVQKNVMGENTDAWAMFMKLYNRDNVGMPSTLPKEWLARKEYKLDKLNPYYLLSDEVMLNRMKDIEKRFGFKLAEGTDDAEHQMMLQRRLATLGNLEAKWEMMSLLSHTKTMANNVFGGTTNSIIATGLKHWKNANNFSFLRENLFPKASSMAEIWRFAEQHGAGESYVNDMLEQSSVARNKDLSNLLVRLRGELKKNPDMRDETLYQSAAEHGFTQKVFDKSAWFMRKTERILRNQSWLAHYLKAREVLEANNYTFDVNDPWLIKMANRGVQATQFLYNNASRPAFARTTMGRLFTRFQMYAWNSFIMRKNIYEGAKAVGYTPGTEEHNRFQRMMLADMMVWGLASLFPASMFNANVPAPYDRLKDMSAFFFGDDREKEKAFYGALPYPMNILQSVSPPSARVPYSVFSGMVSGDWDRFWSYNVWTWFPFGRLANSSIKTLQAPLMLMENMVGLPVHGMVRETRTKNTRKMLNPFVTFE